MKPEQDVTIKQNVRRYADMGLDQICPINNMRESVDGDYILYKDYEALQTERDTLMEALQIIRQVEPVGRVVTVGGYPDESEHTVEWLCKHKDLKDGDLLYTKPQMAEQQPAVLVLVEALEELADLMDDFRNGEYIPDSLTTQPARIALDAYREQKG